MSNSWKSKKRRQRLSDGLEQSLDCKANSADFHGDKGNCSQDVDPQREMVELGNGADTTVKEGGEADMKLGEKHQANPTFSSPSDDVLS